MGSYGRSVGVYDERNDELVCGWGTGGGGVTQVGHLVLWDLHVDGYILWDLLTLVFAL